MSIPGINSVINENSTTGGYDEETDAELLDRYLLKSEIRRQAVIKIITNYGHVKLKA